VIFDVKYFEIPDGKSSFGVKGTFGAKGFCSIYKISQEFRIWRTESGKWWLISSFYDESKRRELWLLFVVLCHPQASDGEVFPVLVLQGVSRRFQGP